MKTMDGRRSTRADDAAFWAKNDADLRQERAAYARLVARVGPVKAAELRAIREKQIIRRGT